MRCPTLVFAVAASYLRRSGEMAIAEIEKRAEIAARHGDQQSVAVWREIATMAEELMNSRLAN